MMTSMQNRLKNTHFMSVLFPQEVKIRGTTKLISFSERTVIQLSDEDRYVHNRLLQINDRLTLLRLKNEAYKSKIYKMKRRLYAKELEPTIKKMKTYRKNILKEIISLKKEKITWEKKLG